jgi:hypothetical protein
MFSGLTAADFLGSLEQVCLRKSFYIVINNNKKIAFYEHFILNQRQISSVGYTLDDQGNGIRYPTG